jgi:hypothetical protein
MPTAMKLDDIEAYLTFSNPDDQSTEPVFRIYLETDTGIEGKSFTVKSLLSGVDANERDRLFESLSAIVRATA